MQHMPVHSNGSNQSFYKTFVVCVSGVEQPTKKNAIYKKKIFIAIRTRALSFKEIIAYLALARGKKQRLCLLRKPKGISNDESST